jgi:hypothetical protein
LKPPKGASGSCGAPFPHLRFIIERIHRMKRDNKEHRCDDGTKAPQSETASTLHLQIRMTSARTMFLLRLL